MGCAGGRAEVAVKAGAASNRWSPFLSAAYVSGCGLTRVSHSCLFLLFWFLQYYCSSLHLGYEGRLDCDCLKIQLGKLLQLLVDAAMCSRHLLWLEEWVVLVTIWWHIPLI